VAPRFKGKAAAGAARTWRLTAKRITDNNEFEQPTPQVKLTEEKLSGFQSGTTVTLPPFSMFVVKWQVE